MDQVVSPPEAVVIAQDEGSEIHIQAATQAGPRHIDVRVWRKGPVGFAPSRNALTITHDDFAAVQDGIRQLLDNSGAGTTATRIVLEREEGRRLRAETEPFGMKFLAKLVFWQRVRDTWRPVDDGLVIMADQLAAVLATIGGFLPWLEHGGPGGDEHAADALQRHVSHSWPRPAADWITIESNRVVLHPLGARITFTVVERDGAHVLTLHQWRRAETLWVGSVCSFDLDLVGVDALLGRIRAIDSGTSNGQPEEVRAGMPCRVELVDGDLLVIDALDTEGEVICRVTIARSQIGRLGRALLLAGSLLAQSLTSEERARIEEMPEDSPAVAEYEAELLPDPTTPIPSTPLTTPYTSIREMILNTIAMPVAPSRNEAEFESARSPVARAGKHADDEEAAIEADEPVDDAEAEEELFEPVPEYLPVTDIRLDRHRVHISVRPGDDGQFAVQWGDRSIVLPIDTLSGVISDFRDLYYDALRGRRGKPIVVGAQPPVTISVLHQSTQLYFALAQDREGGGTHLSFPANEVPLFLDAAREALATAQGEKNG
jgi:hypothetical protein